MQISRKQSLAFTLLDNPYIVDLLFGGGAGGGKSITITQWMAIQCRNFPGVRIGLGRKELKKLKETTIFTLLKETHPLLGITESEYAYKEQAGVINYVNGSSIHLVDLAYLPSDPEYDRFGSLNFTHTVIEEAGEVTQKGRDVFISRKNRHFNGKYNIVGKSITTCNPSINFLKDQYYKPYIKLGGGDYQKWAHGLVTVDQKDYTAYRAYIPSLVTDNPFASPNYIHTLRELPDPERKRLLEGNWDFKSSDYMIFPSPLLDRALTYRLIVGDRYIGVDISDSGGDNTIISLIEKGVLVEQVEVVINKEKGIIGEQIALAVIKYATQNGITDPRRIGIDAIGVGVSTRDFLNKKGWAVREFIAGGKSEGNFKNLRGETIYTMGQAMDKGEFKIYGRMDSIQYSKLRDDLMAHEYTTEERVVLVKSKKDIKEQLGRSPDNAESMYIAFWVSTSKIDPRHDSRRIKF